MRSALSDNQHIILKRLADIHGSRFRLRLGKRSFVVVGDGPGITQIYSMKRSMLSAGLGRKSFLNMFPSQSLIYQSGDRHNMMRRVVSRAWRAVSQDLDYTVELQRLCESLSSADSATQFTSIKRFVVAVAARLTMGAQSDAGSDSRLIEIGERIANSFGGLHVVGLMVPALRKFRRFGKGIQQFKTDMAELSKLVRQIHAAGRYSESSLLAQLQLPYQDQKLTVDEFCDNAGFLFTATIRTVVTFFDNIVNNLAAAQPWQAAIYQELVDHQSTTTLRAAIKETLRMHPVVAAMPRTALVDCHLDDMPIRKGDCVVLSPWISHYDERAYPNPCNYDPSRFLKKRIHDNWVPFGGGQNHCIAGNWSTVFMTNVFQQLLERFEIRSENGHDARRNEFAPTAFAFRGPIAVRRTRSWEFRGRHE